MPKCHGSRTLVNENIFYDAIYELLFWKFFWHTLQCLRLKNKINFNSKALQYKGSYDLPEKGTWCIQERYGIAKRLLLWRSPFWFLDGGPGVTLCWATAMCITEKSFINKCAPSEESHWQEQKQTKTQRQKRRMCILFCSSSRHMLRDVRPV